MNDESNRIEYKRELTDDLEHEIVAFLSLHQIFLLLRFRMKKDFHCH